jgi:hypothetical protein
LGLSAAKTQIQVIFLWPNIHDWILCDNAAVVFDINIKVSAWNHLLSELKNSGQAVGPESVVGIIADLCLQQDLLFLADQSATIDEAPGDVADFGYVGVRRNVVAVWQEEAWEPVWKLLQDRLQMMECH